MCHLLKNVNKLRCFVLKITHVLYLNAKSPTSHLLIFLTKFTMANFLLKMQICVIFFITFACE